MKRAVAPITLFFLLAPALAFASSHYDFKCADVVGTTGGSPPSCVANTLVYSGTPTVSAFTNEPSWVTTGNTYYINFTISGAGTGKFLFFANGGRAGGSTGFFTGPQTVTDFSVVAGSAHDLNFTGGGIAFTGIVSNFCITDTLGGCVPAPPAPSGGGMPHLLTLSGTTSTPASSLVALAGMVGNVWDNTWYFTAFAAGLFLAFLLMSWLLDHLFSSALDRWLGPR